MLGKSTIGGRSSSSSNNRVFVYEVTGLKQNQENDRNEYSFRHSNSVFLSVPYNRMNTEMQRIGKMGGTIINIQSLETFKPEAQMTPGTTATKSKPGKLAEDRH